MAFTSVHGLAAVVATNAPFSSFSPINYRYWRRWAWPLARLLGALARAGTVFICFQTPFFRQVLK